MEILDLEFRLFIREEEILRKVRLLAKKLSEDYKDKDPLFLVVLNGAFVFAADLIRELKFNAQISFIRVSSYQQLTSSGKVKELLGLNENIFNRNLVIVEDIVDTGLTLQYLLKVLEDLGAASIDVISLFLKPGSVKGQHNIKYIGFEIPNHFIVGYGLDYSGYGRNLKDVFIKK